MPGQAAFCWSSQAEHHHEEQAECRNAEPSRPAQQLPPGSILLLNGPLGAGKTSLVQGLAQGLGINEPITSPTFALAQHYTSGHPPLVHLDLYRLEHPAAADELFLQEEEEAKALHALMAVEWSEHLSLSLPEAWSLALEPLASGGRRAQLISPKRATSASVG